MMFPILFIIPLVQLIILANAATMEIKNVDLVVCDNDLSAASRRLTGKFEGSPFFRIRQQTFSADQAIAQIQSGKADAAIIIPSQFERRLVRDNKAGVQVLVNAINGAVAGISSSYITTIIAGYNKEVIAGWYGLQKGSAAMTSIEVIPQYWYNPGLNYKVFMVPAILVLLVTITGMFLAAMNIVREKETGTIEQINVTPIRKHQFIIGKLVPFWIIAMLELALGLTLGKLLFNIPMIGNLGLLFFVTGIYLMAMQGIGLFFSTMANTQQQAMFVSFFFMIVFTMMSGIFTPAESMPQWAQYFNYLNPVAYFMKMIRMILLKGSDFMDIWKMIAALAVYAMLMLSLAIRRYRKTA